jgi:hypothetical protein
VPIRKSGVNTDDQDHDKHFDDVNVLGADFLVENGLTLKANYSNKICTLLVEENE